jgi:hypothetical protein
MNGETMVEMVERVMDAQPDPYILLGSAKLHLANRVMEVSDVEAWWICSDAQEQVAEEWEYDA